ncbi:Ral guanine nucleotide [Nesidiocoris tenuis]|uniref:Ral guanine nucleotide n=1 Tax=Nesidiocoris tenuis TaxID=355587 RepID=A0ABN7AAT8_9HEMI|nr:Ral guanine nucleotide [Nesidiocoris tenuis]
MNLDVDNLQPTWKVWGDEKVDGAIYTIYLKKVRYHRPTHTIASADDCGESISHLEWETVKVRLLKAGTLQRLVEALATDEGELESTYVNIFLATYRTFATAHQVLTLLLDRYEQLANNELDLPEQVAIQHRKTLVGALHVWLESYPEDWCQPPLHPMLRQVLLFTQHHLPNSELHIKLKHRLQSLQSHTKPKDAYSLYNGSLCLHTTSTQPPYHFPDIPHLHFAEQLTRIDMELFKKVIVHQCLGGVWSRREKRRAEEAPTVLATVTQFNAVSLRVISTILLHAPSPKASVIAGWIDIAQELRVLKNFSSLKAIISGLQANPVYRLQKIWTLVPKDKIELFEELARIFSEENNQWAQRDLLMREGTARFADTVGHNDKQLQKIIQRQLNNSGTISYGTIPYLGTFLTDLTMIDAAIPDTLPDGLINFDKRRKEFEVLAQIKLLQGAANAYTIQEDPSFERWFDSVLVLDDKEAYQLSCQIEQPPLNTPLNSRIKGHRKNDSVASTSSSSSSQFYCDIDHASTSVDTKDSVSQTSSSSNGSLDKDGTPVSPSLSASQGPTDFYIIKVTYQTDNVETDGIVLYKSIMLSNNERTPQVIRNAMMKLGLEGSPDNYTISQVLGHKEMVMPQNANVYYAVNTEYNLNFILRPKNQPSPVGFKKPSKPFSRG